MNVEPNSGDERVPDVDFTIGEADPGTIDSNTVEFITVRSTDVAA